MRRPTVCVTAERAGIGRRLLEAHPHLGGMPLFNFANDQPTGGAAFQAPGEGPWRVFPPPPYTVTRWPDNAAGDRRIDNTVEAAAELGAFIHASEPRSVVWEIGGAYSGVVAIGIARAIGRCVVVAPAGPDRLSIAMADKHGVSLKSVLDAEDQRKAIAFLGGF